VRIGTAFIDRGRCIPWAMGKTCIVCEEWCPTAIKAVYFYEEDFVDRDGKTLRLKRPYIDPAQCTGCGACEFACPVVDRPAVYVTAIGESRSSENQILLERRRTAASGAGRR
jgi:ferredoxin